MLPLLTINDRLSTIIGSQQIFIEHCCEYLVLCNTPPQNSVAWNNNTYFTLEISVWVGLSGTAHLYSCKNSWGDSAGAGRLSSRMAYSHGWQVDVDRCVGWGYLPGAWAPLHIGLSSGLHVLPSGMEAGFQESVFQETRIGNWWTLIRLGPRNKYSVTLVVFYWSKKLQDPFNPKRRNTDPPLQ